MKFTPAIDAVTDNRELSFLSPFKLPKAQTCQFKVLKRGKGGVPVRVQVFYLGVKFGCLERKSNGWQLNDE